MSYSTSLIKRQLQYFLGNVAQLADFDPGALFEKSNLYELYDLINNLQQYIDYLGNDFDGIDTNFFPKPEGDALKTKVDTFEDDISTAKTTAEAAKTTTDGMSDIVEGIATSILPAGSSLATIAGAGGALGTIASNLLGALGITGGLIGAAGILGATLGDAYTSWTDTYTLLHDLIGPNGILGTSVLLARQQYADVVGNNNEFYFANDELPTTRAYILKRLTYLYSTFDYDFVLNYQYRGQLTEFMWAMKTREFYNMNLFNGNVGIRVGLGPYNSGLIQYDIYMDAVSFRCVKVSESLTNYYFMAPTVTDAAIYSASTYCTEPFVNGSGVDKFVTVTFDGYALGYIIFSPLRTYTYHIMDDNGDFQPATKYAYDVFNNDTCLQNATTIGNIYMQKIRGEATITKYYFLDSGDWEMTAHVLYAIQQDYPLAFTRAVIDAGTAYTRLSYAIWSGAVDANPYKIYFETPLFPLTHRASFCLCITGSYGKWVRLSEFCGLVLRLYIVPQEMP